MSALCTDAALRICRLRECRKLGRDEGRQERGGRGEGPPADTLPVPAPAPGLHAHGDPGDVPAHRRRADKSTTLMLTSLLR
jgi:hypothetical protein